MPPNKAIVGSNAFAHESGIHQDGIIKKRETYEIMRAQDIGLSHNRLVLGKHSGRNALKTRLNQLGFSLTPDELNHVFDRFKELADQKKEIYDEDLEVIASDDLAKTNEWSVVDVSITMNLKSKPRATVKLTNRAGKIHTQKATGTGPVDAAYQAVNQIIQEPVKLSEFSMNTVTAGIDAQAIVTVKVYTQKHKTYTGRSAHTNMIVASVRSYVSALNKVITNKKRLQASS